ncbi:hypothetical protein AAFC00_005570 [Neodothiora populina]|uniref:PAC domain-containing protein n=1 Tax=Neodothiora populina TaxID=2781224 RepID=A0ABR3PLA8_9PEZI
MSSVLGSISPDPVFEEADRLEQLEHHISLTERTSVQNSGEDEQGEYDLKPPPPSVAHSNVEALAERFFSVDHLNVILRDASLHYSFAQFLHHHKPHCVDALNRYLDVQKATLALEYANAITSRGQTPYQAASMSDEFCEDSREAVEELLTDALPAALTHQLTRLVCESLVKEITQTSAPIMRELIPSLAEVYCIADPSLPDNPIVYASEEFYRTTQYGKDYAIGRNCRFLQGPKTSPASVKRLVEAITSGQEITETILNYRRDGTPFMNLLLLAPLYDNKGTVRYFLGCQIDVSPLLENGRGIESFARLLQEDRHDSRYGGMLERQPATVLNDLLGLLNDKENETFKTRSRGGGSGTVTPQTSMRGARRVLGMDAPERLWPRPEFGPSGRLPGVYQNYLLVRPHPSLRITFTSPALRIPGLLQTKFLDRVGGPQHVREGVMDSLARGTSVTAKISWLTSTLGRNSQGSISMESKPRWIHCTPLMGSDERIGVWMIVMVESEEITGMINTRPGTSEMASSPLGAASPRFTESKLYTEYLRREGREIAPFTRSPESIFLDNRSVPSRESHSRRTVGGEAHPFQDYQNF